MKVEEQQAGRKKAQKSALDDSLEVPKDFKAYDKAWQKEYRNLAFQEGFYTAVGGATFFGMFGTFSKMLLDKAAGKKIEHDPVWTPVTIVGMMLFGAFVGYMANVKQAAKQKLEDNRLAHRINAGGEVKMHLQEESENTGQESMKPETYWQDRIKISKAVFGYDRAA